MFDRFIDIISLYVNPSGSIYVCNLRNYIYCTFIFTSLESMCGTQEVFHTVIRYEIFRYNTNNLDTVLTASGTRD